MRYFGPRRPQASQVLPYAGAGLGLNIVTGPTRQWQRPARRVRQVIPVDWRPQGPQLTFGAGANADAATTGPDAPCEDCN